MKWAEIAFFCPFYISPHNAYPYLPIHFTEFSLQPSDFLCINRLSLKRAFILPSASLQPFFTFRLLSD